MLLSVLQERDRYYSYSLPATMMNKPPFTTPKLLYKDNTTLVRRMGN